jgi:hypothetical protein
MIIKLPTIKRIPLDKNGNVVDEHSNEDIVDIKVVKEEITFSVDLSAYAEERFHRYIEETVADKSLTEYAQRIASIKTTDQAMIKASYLSIIKLLYCYLESDKTPTLKDFIKLFDIIIATEILKKTKTILELALKSATKN